MKFYQDEDLSPAIAIGLRKRGLDAVSAHEAGNVGLLDREQLVFATGQRRCLVSANVRDFNALSRAAIEEQRPHAGIVLCPPRIHGPDIGAMVKALIEIAERYPAGLGEYNVVYL